MSDNPRESVYSKNHDEPPEVPGFRTWKAVYLFVFAAFVAFVAVLAAFSHYFR